MPTHRVATFRYDLSSDNMSGGVLGGGAHSGRRTMLTAKETASLQHAAAHPPAARIDTRRFDFVWLAVALCVGALVIFWRLTDKSLIPDEAFYYRESISPLPLLVQITVYGNFHPPLFYLIFHYLDAWLHLPAPDYRYFTAPFGLVTILASWALARRWFGGAAASIAALVVATEPML